jgi:DNA-binding response OmpR family regulator
MATPARSDRYGSGVAVVAIIEDDPRIRSAVLRALTDLGHAVRAYDAGMPALEAVVADPPDVVVLDLGLPDIDGRQWLQMFRGLSQVPVIAATARDAEQEMIRTLDLGADDYVVKPFSGAQLEARIRAVLRRTASGEEAGAIEVGELVVDVRSRTVTLAGAELALSRKEFDVLAYLAGRAGEVVTKRELLADLWQQPWGGADKTVDVHLSWLRRKLGESAAEPRYLHTVRGVGVRLAAPHGA